MKIAAILSQTTLLDTVKDALEDTVRDDHFIFLQRKEGELEVDRLDLYSTNILIVDFDYANEADLKVISECTTKSSNPAVILLTQDKGEARLLDYMRNGVSEVVGLPLDKLALIDAIERLRKKRYIASTYHPRGKILSFISAKGGSGATFLAGNLAYDLATQHDLQILFIDLNMQFGDAGFYFSDVVGGPSIVDIVAQTGLDSTIIASASIHVQKNFNLLQAPDSPDRAGAIRPHHIDNLLTVAIQDYDFVIVDLPRIIDATVMKVLDRSDKIYLVSQPVIPYIRATSKVLDLFNQLDYTDSKVDLVINRMERNHSISKAKIENTLQAEVKWVVPNDFVNCMDSTNTGTPVQKHNPNSDVAQCISAIANTLVDGEHAPESTGWARIFPWLGSRR